MHIQHNIHVQVMFVPKAAGNYEAVLSVFARLVVSEKDPDHPVATVILKAVAEDPKLEIRTAHPGSRASSSVHTSHPPVLDYGVLVGGTSVSLPLLLTNRGAAAIPLRLSITSQVFCLAKTDRLSKLFIFNRLLQLCVIKFQSYFFMCYRLPCHSSISISETCPSHWFPPLHHPHTFTLSQSCCRRDKLDRQNWSIKALIFDSLHQRNTLIVRIRLCFISCMNPFLYVILPCILTSFIPMFR